MNLTVFLLALCGGVGATHIFVDGRIMNWFREWAKDIPFLKEIVQCHQCFGCWMGMVCALLVGIFNPFEILLMGGAVSFFSMLGRATLDYLEMNTIIDLPNEETPTT